MAISMRLNVRRRTAFATATGLPRYARNDRVGTRVRMRGGLVTRTHLKLSLRGAERCGNLDEVERTSTHRLCYGDGIAALRSQ